jgi:hypothetical protein
MTTSPEEQVEMSGKTPISPFLVEIPVRLEAHDPRQLLDPPRYLRSGSQSKICVLNSSKVQLRRCDRAADRAPCHVDDVLAHLPSKAEAPDAS